MNYNFKKNIQIAYDWDMYTLLVCRAVARSHQADWRRKRRLKEETAGPEACGRRHHDIKMVSQTFHRCCPCPKPRPADIWLIFTFVWRV